MNRVSYWEWFVQNQMYILLDVRFMMDRERLIKPNFCSSLIYARGGIHVSTVNEVVVKQFSSNPIPFAIAARSKLYIPCQFVGFILILFYLLAFFICLLNSVRYSVWFAPTNSQPIWTRSKHWLNLSLIVDPKSTQAIAIWILELQLHQLHQRPQLKRPQQRKIVEA